MIITDCRSQSEYNSISDYVKKPGASEIILQNKKNNTPVLLLRGEQLA